LQEWSASDLTPLGGAGTGADFGDVAYAPGPDRHVVSSTVGGVLTLWCRRADGALEPRHLDRGQMLSSIAFHPTEPRMFTASVSGHVGVWDTVAWRQVVSIHGHSSVILGMRFVPATDELLTTSMDSTVRVWRTASRTPR
jgi:WD40 repeat protein